MTPHRSHPTVGTHRLGGRTRRLAAVLAVLALAGAGCSASGGNGASGPDPDGPSTTVEGEPSTTTTPDEPVETTTTEPEETTTTEPEVVEAEDFDPCDLVGTRDLEPFSTDGAFSLARGLSPEDARLDECRISLDDGYLSVGVVAIDQGDLDELTPSTDVYGTTLPVEAVDDLGDDAYRQVEEPTYVYAVEQGSVQVRVRFDWYEVSETGRRFDAYEEPLLDLIEAVLDELPEAVPEGGVALPDVCDGLDRTKVEAVVGEVVLARGADDGEGIYSCDVLGDTGTRSLVTVSTPGSDSDLVGTLLSIPGRWRPIKAGDKGAARVTGQSFIVQVGEQQVTLDAYDEVQPPDGTETDSARKELLNATLDLADTTA